MRPTHNIVITSSNGIYFCFFHSGGCSTAKHVALAVKEFLDSFTGALHFTILVISYFVRSLCSSCSIVIICTLSFYTHLFINFVFVTFFSPLMIANNYNCFLFFFLFPSSKLFLTLFLCHSLNRSFLHD